MTRTAVATLLDELRQIGATVTPSGSTLLVDAPRGAVTTELRDALQSAKPELLSFLSLQERLLSMTLEQFGQQSYALEVSVASFPSTLWFVPRESGAEALRRKGVRRGRIWTADELTNLIGIPGLSREQALTIARMKAAFCGEIASVEVPDGASGGRGDA